MQKNRLETLTDGIVAIVITILVLNLPVPKNASLSALTSNWRAFVVYVLTFIIILAVWFNHHVLFSISDQINRSTYWINGCWLLCQSFLPYTASWLSRYPDNFYPGMVYICINLIWTAAYILLVLNLQKINARVRKPTKKYLLALIITFVIELLLLFVSPILSMVLAFGFTSYRVIKPSSSVHLY
jgi:uncharacterized membrane protein